MGGGYSMLGVSQWMWVGRREFGRRGYLEHARAGGWSDADIPSQAGRVHIVTGATAGLGRATATRLAAAGGIVHIIGRDRDRTNAAAADIRVTTGNPEVHVHVVDLVDADAVKAWAAAWRTREDPRIHSLVNNAGVLLNKHELTPSGVEVSWATMMNQTYLLTGLLLPCLRSATPPGRVINVSSGGQYAVHFDVEDPFCTKGRKFDGVQQYAHVKRAQVMLSDTSARACARLAGGSAPGAAGHVIVNSMHPGWAATPGVATSIPDFEAQHRDDLRSAEQGADTIVWLAASASPAASATSGEFFFDRRVVPKSFPLSGTASSVEEEAKLWSMCASLTGFTWPDA